MDLRYQNNAPIHVCRHASYVALVWKHTNESGITLSVELAKVVGADDTRGMFLAKISLHRGGYYFAENFGGEAIPKDDWLYLSRLTDEAERWIDIHGLFVLGVGQQHAELRHGS